MITNKNRCLKIIISFLIYSLLSVLIFFKIKWNILYGAGDMQFHLRRLMELKESVDNGEYFPIYSFNYFHGSAVMGMYPYLSIYPLLMIVLGMHSFIRGYYVFTIFITFLSCLISFFSSLRYSKDTLISYVFSIIYSTSSTFTFELFFNGDLGVLMALVFLPLVIFGFLDLLNGYTNYVKLTVGIVLLAFCQVPAFTLTILFILFWSLINIKKIFKENILLNLIKSIILSIILTSIVWIPLIKLLLTNHMHTVGSMQLNGTSLKFFIENISFIAIISLILSVFFISRFNHFDRQMYLMSLFVIFMSSKLMPWHFVTSIPILHGFNQFQYSYRFLIIPQLLLCYLFAVVLISIINKKKYCKVMMILFLVFVAILQLGTQFIVLHKKINNKNFTINSYKSVKAYNDFYSPNANFKYSTHGYLLKNNDSIKYFINGVFPNGDYYPLSSYPYEKNIYNNLGKANNKKDILLHHYSNNMFMFYNKNKIKYITLPFIIYNHERLHLYLNNKRINWSANKHSLLTLNHINEGKNLLKIQYVPDYRFNLIKYSLLILGLLWILIYMYKRRHLNVKYNNTNL